MSPPASSDSRYCEQRIVPWRVSGIALREAAISLAIVLRASPSLLLHLACSVPLGNHQLELKLCLATFQYLHLYSP